MKFGVMAKHRGIWLIALMCVALDVFRGGFYSWLMWAPRQRSLDKQILSAHIRQSIVGSDRIYGARRGGMPFWRLGYELGVAPFSASCVNRRYGHALGDWVYPLTVVNTCDSRQRAASPISG